MEGLKNAIFILFHPKYWLMLQSYNEALDRWVQQALLVPRFQKKGNGAYHVILNKKVFWVCNEPYGFELCSDSNWLNTGLNIRPSRRTVHKFYKAYRDWLSWESEE